MKTLIRVVVGTLLLMSTTTLSAKNSNVDSDNFIKALERFEKYSDTQWSEYPAIEGTGYWGSGFSGERAGLRPGYTPNDAIRSMNGTALANAVLIMANPDSPLNKERLAKVEKVLRYSALTHKKSGTDYKCIDGYQWGLGWQTNMWAGSMGFTCSLLEDKLPAELVAQVKKIVAAEADFRSGLKPGSDYIGNTIAEENAWNTNIVALASAWMSDDPRAEKWLNTAKKYMVNTYSVAADKNGDMKEWSSTINLYPSFMLENHGFYHPGYHNVSGSSLGDSYLMAKLNNEKVAEELTPFAEHNVLNVWNKVKNVLKTNGELFFPCGQDWSLHNHGHVAYISYIATHFKQGEAIEMQKHVIQLLLARQDLFGTGEFIGKSNENTFYVEAVTARRIALAWLHNYVNDFELAAPKKLENFSSMADDVKIITSRSDKGNISLSYGRRILLAVETTPGNTPETRYIFCSDNLSLIGCTPVGNVVRAQLKEYKLNDSGFTASLKLTATDGDVDCDIYAKDGVVAIVQIPHNRTSLSKAMQNSFQFSVENYVMNGSERTIYHDDNVSERVAEASGCNKEFGNILNISNDFGVIYGPSATTSYVGPKSYNRKGASTDRVGAVLENPFEPSYAVIVCNEDFETTQEVAKSISFTMHEDGASLEFISPDGVNVKCGR